MARCLQCSGYLMYEPQFIETPARYKCTACGWMLADPNFRNEKPRYFPSESVDKRLGWQKENPGYDLYEPKSAACQLGVSVSHLKDYISATPWWDNKKHHER